MLLTTGFSIHNFIIYHEKERHISRATNDQVMWKYFWNCASSIVSPQNITARG